MESHSGPEGGVSLCLTPFLIKQLVSWPAELQLGKPAHLLRGYSPWTEGGHPPWTEETLRGEAELRGQLARARDDGRCRALLGNLDYHGKEPGVTIIQVSHFMLIFCLFHVILMS